MRQDLQYLVEFKETIDRYFDKVFVMVEDERVRANRLALLTKIKDMFLTYGDFSKIRVEEISRHPVRAVGNCRQLDFRV